VPKNLDYIARLERAISRKYGPEAILNPKAGWSEEKEKHYLEQLKSLDKKETYSEKVEINGVLVPKKLVSREIKRVCPTCKTYSFSLKDDVYMAKYECCARLLCSVCRRQRRKMVTGLAPRHRR
jgi:hypothetical protein